MKHDVCRIVLESILMFNGDDQIAAGVITDEISRRLKEFGVVVDAHELALTVHQIWGECEAVNAASAKIKVGNPA